MTFATALTGDKGRDRPRTLDEAKAWMLDRAAKQLHPMNLLSLEDSRSVIEGLTGLDAVTWAAAWRERGEEAWSEAESAGDRESARQQYERAYGFFFLGRFPAPRHPDKAVSARRERDAYLALGRMMDPPIERVTVPFSGREGEGNEVVFLLRRPHGVEKPPVVVMWGGIDSWKEQNTQASDLLLAEGIATVSMDGPGTGEAPVKGVADAERQYLPVFDWLAARSDLAGAKPGLLGRSFGGYWSTRLAHLYPERFTCAVNWGGGAHFMFQPDWIAQSRYPDTYLMELVETRQHMLGVKTWDEYLEGFHRLSLLDQGLLDGPSAPMLLVNGKEDLQCPVADIDLLVGHGRPKSVRMFPGGHMGLTPQTLPTIIDWVVERMEGVSA